MSADDEHRNFRSEVLDGLSPTRKRPRGHVATPSDDPAVAESMVTLYREHGALQALAEDDPSLLPVGMTMDEARLLVREAPPPGPEAYDPERFSGPAGMSFDETWRFVHGRPTLTDDPARRQAVEAAIANARLAGVDMTPETLAVFERYVAGEIDDEEMVRLVGMGDLSTNVSALSEASDHDVREYRKHVEWRAACNVSAKKL